MKIKGLISENTIVLKYEGKEVNIQRQNDEDQFLRISQLMLDKKESELIQTFLDIKQKIENHTQGVFTVEHNKIVLKGTNKPVPELLSNKLIESSNKGQDFLPLIRFWKKLSQNPSKNSREQLYGFMVANKIPLTDGGDIVVEKGVRQKPQSYPGHLVDGYTRKIDNSIGCTVSMPRDKVDDDANQTCSYGLHVGAPAYVRRWYTNDIIVECIVDPVDVVSVPTDYNNTKMRVCKYRVVGYSNKSRNPDKVVKLDSFIKSPSIEDTDKIQKHIEREQSYGSGHNIDQVSSIKQIEVSEQDQTLQQKLSQMTAKNIIAYVQQHTGERITLNVKNKKGIIKKALILLEIAQIQNQDEIDDQKQKQIQNNTINTDQGDEDKEVKQVNLSQYLEDKSKRKELLDLIRSKFNEKVSKFTPTKTIIKKATELFEKAGYQVK